MFIPVILELYLVNSNDYSICPIQLSDGITSDDTWIFTESSTTFWIFLWITAFTTRLMKDESNTICIKYLSKLGWIGAGLVIAGATLSPLFVADFYQNGSLVKEECVCATIAVWKWVWFSGFSLIYMC